MLTSTWAYLMITELQSVSTVNGKQDKMEWKAENGWIENKQNESENSGLEEQLGESMENCQIKFEKTNTWIQVSKKKKYVWRR